MMPLDVALLWTERLTALAIALQTIELLAIRRALADDGVWRWSILRSEHAEIAAPLRWLLGALLPYRAFVGLLLARLGLAVALGLGVTTAAWPLCLGQLAVNARFRGTFNGGSDYLSMVLLLGLSVAAISSGDAFVRAGLGYICVQLVLSYFIAGLVKLRQSAWRSGVALGGFLASPRYGVPDWLARRAPPALTFVASWLVMSFELAFPLALARPAWAMVAAGLGVLFHVANALLFGLNRFLFAWAAAYPALLYFSAALHGN